ncbi:MAG: response regulator transcription factor, partial [Stackebrandtia sp.]
LPYHTAQVTEQIFRFRMVTGQRPDTEALKSLTVEYERLGATRAVARCSHLLRTSGVTVRSRQGRRGFGDALSPRERDVARLVAGGHTNKEIAQVLFLSCRTVEQHVSRVLRKSGVASRHELRM